jgi:hypothetical protein
VHNLDARGRQVKREGYLSGRDRETASERPITREGACARAREQACIEREVAKGGVA